MFHTKVEGYVYHGEYYDPYLRGYRKGLVVPVRSMIDEPKIGLPPDGKSKADRLVVDELAARMENKAKECEGSRRCGTNETMKGSEVPTLDVMDDDISVGYTKRGNNELCVTETMLASHDTVPRTSGQGEDVETKDVEMVDGRDGEDIPVQLLKRLPQGPGKFRCEGADSPGGNGDEVEDEDILKSLLDDEAEEVQFVDEHDIRRDDLKYLNLVGEDSDNDED